jgi:hypothetical protein
MTKETPQETSQEEPKDKYGRPLDHWSQGSDKVKDLVDTDDADK